MEVNENWIPEINRKKKTEQQTNKTLPVPGTGYNAGLALRQVVSGPVQQWSDSDWYNAKMHEVNDLLHGYIPGHTPASAVKAAEAIIHEILADGRPESYVAGMRQFIDEIKQWNYTKFATGIIPGGGW